MRSVTPVTVTNVFEWSQSIQKNYMQFWTDFQKSWKK